MKDNLIAARINDKLHKRFNALCERHRLSKTDMIRRMVANFPLDQGQVKDPAPVDPQFKAIMSKLNDIENAILMG